MKLPNDSATRDQVREKNVQFVRRVVGVSATLVLKVNQRAEQRHSVEELFHFRKLLLTATCAVGCCWTNPAFEPGLGFTAAVQVSEPSARRKVTVRCHHQSHHLARVTSAAVPSSQPGFNPLAPQTPVSGSDASERVAPW